MSLASIGAELDLATARRPGTFVYRIHGSIYRRLGAVSGIDGAMPKSAQIFLFDTEAATDVRLSPLEASPCGPRFLRYTS